MTNTPFPHGDGTHSLHDVERSNSINPNDALENIVVAMQLPAEFLQTVGPNPGPRINRNRLISKYTSARRVFVRALDDYKERGLTKETIVAALNRVEGYDGLVDVTHSPTVAELRQQYPS